MPKQTITLETLCWNQGLEQSFVRYRQDGLLPARVAVEDKHHYVLFNERGPLIGTISGKLLHTSRSPAELPKVGDWVAFELVPNQDKAIIHDVLPRRSTLSRKVPGRETVEQVLVTNVDLAFVVQAFDRSFNPGLIQRYLAMVKESAVAPVIVLNKADLCEEIEPKLASVASIADRAPVIAVSARNGRGMEGLTRMVRPGQTVVFLGASGVGKSSLINHLYGDDVLPTSEVRESDAKGRHTTTWRELIVLPNGGLVIDTPGMREFQMWLSGETGREAFADVEAIALGCHFRRCSHTTEARCAVRSAVERGELSGERYESYLKLQRELTFLNQAAHRRELIDNKRRTRVARRALDRRRSPEAGEADE